MNWSGAALKATIGAGSLPVVAILGDELAAVFGVWGMIAFCLVPVSLLIFVKPGEIADKYVKGVHLIAAVWYVAMVGATFAFMFNRGIERTDYLMGGIMMLGFIPVFVICRNLYLGRYDALSGREGSGGDGDFDLDM